MSIHTIRPYVGEFGGVRPVVVVVEVNPIGSASLYRITEAHDERTGATLDVERLISHNGTDCLDRLISDEKHGDYQKKTS